MFFKIALEGLLLGLLLLLPTCCFTTVCPGFSNLTLRAPPPLDLVVGAPLPCPPVGFLMIFVPTRGMGILLRGLP